MGHRPNHLPRSAEQLKIVGRDELNLAEFPIASLSHRVPEDCKQLVFEDEIRDQATGEIVPRKLTVTGHATLGLPNSLDDDVIVVLMHITKERTNFSSRTVPFHRMEVVETLGWPRNGQSIDRLEESLSKWLGVSLRYDRAWWDKAAQEWRNEQFHIIDNVSSFDRKIPRRTKQNPQQTSLHLSTFTWNDVVFGSFQAGNVKSIDLHMYFKLSLAQSRRAYRFLDKRFYRETELRFDLKSFATAKIGFSTAYSAAKIKEKLQPALDELEGVGFLEPMSRDKRYEKISHGTWKIVLVRGNAEKCQEIESDDLEQLEPPPLVAALLSRGVSDKTAAKLVEEHPDRVEIQLDVLDSLPKKKREKIADDAAWLVAAIRDNHPTPKNFVPRAERERREAAARQRKQDEAEAELLKHQAAAREKALDDAVEAHIRQLGPDERAALETQLVASADPATRRNLKNPATASFRDTMVLLMLRDHVRQVLIDQAASLEAPPPCPANAPSSDAGEFPLGN